MSFPNPGQTEQPVPTETGFSDTKITDVVQSKEAPEISKINGALTLACSNITAFLDRCTKNYNVVKCKWANQSDDQRKHASSDEVAYPFDGASDAKVPLVDDSTRFIKSAFKTSMGKMRIQAIPITGGKDDVEKAHYASYFLKTIKQNIPNWDAFVDYELGQMFDIAGVSAAKVEYMKERRLIKREYTLDQMSEVVQQVVAANDPEKDKLLIAIFVKEYPKMTTEQLTTCLEELRSEGKTTVTFEKDVREGVRVFPMSLCENLILPAGIANVQDSPYVFEVRHLTPEQLLQEAQDKGWDETWAKEVVNNQLGYDSVATFLLGKNSRAGDKVTSRVARMDGLVQIVYCWEKRIDKKTGAIGIYYTVYHPNITDKYGVFQLSDCDDGLYPFIVRKRENLELGLYDTRALSEVLEGYQFTYKECVDNASNRESMETFPPYEVSAVGGLDNAEAQGIGPGTPMVSHMGNAFNWKSPIDSGSSAQTNVLVRGEIVRAVDQYVGRPSQLVAPSEAAAKVQAEVDNFGGFITEVLKMAEAKTRQFMPSEYAFKLNGMQDMYIWKNNDHPEYDYIITYDASTMDDLEKKINMFASLMQSDRTGKIGNSQWIESVAPMIDPVIADRILTPDNTAVNKSLSEERSAIDHITSGQDIDMDENEPFNQVKADYLQRYLQTPAGQRCMQDPITAPIMEKHMKQMQFKYEQNVQNAQVGKIGTMPGMAGQMAGNM